MNVIKYNVNSGDVCQIGRQYEYGKTQVIFEGYQVTDSANEIYFKFVGRTEDSKYLIPIVDMTLDITQQLTKHVGQFSCQLEEMNTEGTLVSQSPVFYVAVKRSIKVGADYEVQDPRLETIYQKYNQMYNTISQTNETSLANESQRQSEWLTLKQEVSDAINSFDADIAISEFRTLVQTETNNFNTNSETKFNAYNQNDSQKTTAYNTNANEKLNAYNTNAENKVSEFNAQTEQIQTDISELKSDLNDIEKNINRFITLYPEFNYEFGYITSAGTEIANTTTIKTKYYLQFPVGANFSIAEGFKYRIYFYTSKDSSTLLVDSMSGYWHTEPYVIDETHASYYAKIVISKEDDSEISDIDSIKNSLSVIYPATESDIISRVTNCETEVAKSSISYIPILSAYMESMNSGDVLTVSATFDCNKNDVEEFFANITSFDTLTVAHGGSDRFMGGDVVITNTEVMIKTYNNTVLKSEAHGLTISDFIYVCIEKDDKTNAKVTIMSKSGTYALQTTAGTYYGVNGAIKASTTSELTNATLKYIAKDLSKDTWLFGDSYITLNDNGKYMTQLVNMGFADKICSCGYGGAASVNIMFDFRNLTAIAKPKRIVWALGMNDKDGDNSVNANWNAFYNEVRTYCDSNGIELILATIPNTPSVSTANSYKNEIVRASGYRYIDFAKAVNAESDNSSWFDGMLSSDNVHPTELGAKVLASRFLMDVPEII